MKNPSAPRLPEVLAPAGDDEAMRAAVHAGADAVYFGLQGFNARARARNFDADKLSETMAWLHARGVRGYVTLNTLVFDHELASVEAAVRTCAQAGVDAVIVQDLGVARVVRAIAPELHIHASTQMTCTDASSVEFARNLGASRVILARELSVDEIAAIRAETDAELEVFVHGALCIAYSGQCLTSEAIGGRSANRGACAQACRLPYELVVDGEQRDLGDRAYLLSPEDLESSAQVGALAASGISSLKIEGRLKGPAYVAATVKLYRAAIDAAREAPSGDLAAMRETALQTYSRGSGPGFLAGVNHQRLVEARGCDHRGLYAGECEGTERQRGRTYLNIRPSREIARGDGLVVEGAGQGAGEVGGRVWSLSVHGKDVESAPAGELARVWLGPDKAVHGALGGRRVFRNNDPNNERAVLGAIERDPHRVAIDVVVRGAIGELPVFEARSARGAFASVQGETPVEPARSQSLTREVLVDKLGRLGETPFALGELRSELPDGTTVSPSSLNRARRALTDALIASSQRQWSTTETSYTDLLARAHAPSRNPAPAGLFVLCRTLEQCHAAIDAQADGVYLDFLELTGTGAAVRALRERGKIHITLCPPRIRKPSEEKIDKYLLSLAPDAVLVRGLGALRDGALNGVSRIGDFSLNVTNRLTAAEVLGAGLDAFTPSFDLDSTQLLALTASDLAPWSEVVVHHPMPLFHMEHCVIAALLSTGKDYRDCGRPCDRHKVSLRDRAGMDHPVEADVGCRNTVFHAAAQSAAGIVPSLTERGVRRFRVELVRESAEDVGRIVSAYKALLTGASTTREVWKSLRADGGYGVVRGSLRTLV